MKAIVLSLAIAAASVAAFTAPASAENCQNSSGYYYKCY
jgi:hypothetical protein